MSNIEFLKSQMIETRIFTKRLIREFPDDKWFVIPENTNSNFAWQIGHIIASQNFHTLTVVSGRNSKVAKNIPLDMYNRIFRGMGSSERSVESGFVTVQKFKRRFGLG